MCPIPFTLSLSKGWFDGHEGFDKLSPNGYRAHRGTPPFALSLSKGWFDGHRRLRQAQPERFMYIA
jgi:hypothetical protein